MNYYRSRSKNELKKRRKQKNRMFVVHPSAPIDWNKPARLAIVEKGRGRILKYYFDSLSHQEVKLFWRMTKNEKVEYLDKYFNCHHRNPRCQGGKTILSNLSYVERNAHTNYNKLIFVVSRWSGISIEKVRTLHIRCFLRQVYPLLLRVYMHQDTCKMKSLEEVTRRSDYHNGNRYLSVQVAKWAGLRFNLVKASDICHFIEYLHPVLKKLAVDHESGKLMHLGNFIKLLNKVWLPIDKPIIL